MDFATAYMTLIWDKTVTVTKDKTLQKCMLHERKLTLNHAIDMYLASAVTNTQVQAIAGSQEEVHEVMTKKSPKKQAEARQEGTTIQATRNVFVQRHEFKKEKCPAYGATHRKCKG